MVVFEGEVFSEVVLREVEELSRKQFVTCSIVVSVLFVFVYFCPPSAMNISRTCKMVAKTLKHIRLIF